MNWICWKIRRILPTWIVCKLFKRAGLAWGATCHPKWNHVPEDSPRRLRRSDWFDSWDMEMLDRNMFRWSPKVFELVGSGVTHSFMFAWKMANKELKDASDKTVPGPEQSGN